MAFHAPTPPSASPPVSERDEIETMLRRARGAAPRCQQQRPAERLRDGDRQPGWRGLPAGHAARAGHAQVCPAPGGGRGQRPSPVGAKGCHARQSGSRSDRCCAQAAAMRRRFSAPWSLREKLDDVLGRKPSTAADDLRRATRRGARRREATHGLHSLWARLRAAWRSQ